MTSPRLLVCTFLVLSGMPARMHLLAQQCDSSASPGAQLQPIHGWYIGLFWMLDDEQQRVLLRLTPRAFDDSRAAWGMTLARTHALRGDTVAARAYADSARIALQQETAANPEDGVTRGYYGLSLAMAGRRAEAAREGEQAVKLEPTATNGITSPLVQFILVLTYVALGDEDAALERLEPLLRIPFYVSPAWLAIDPELASLRDNPRFRRLIASK